MHESQLVKIDDDFPLDLASLLACGVITGFGAVVNRAQVRRSSSVVVIGTGGVGLNAVQGAVVCGANPIIAVDIVDSKLKRAREFGATHAVNGQGGRRGRRGSGADRRQGRRLRLRDGR